MTVELYLGDCLEIMQELEDNSVDAVITDPPWNANKGYGKNGDNLSPREYTEFLGDAFSLSDRVSRNGLAVFVAGKLTKLMFGLLPDSHLTVIHKKASGTHVKGYMHQYHSLFSTITPVMTTKDLWDEFRLPGEGYFFREERFDHPGLTSCHLTKKIINSFTKPSDTVLDPFMGSGTTGVACVQTGRNFIGIEIEPKYYEIAEKRIAEAQLQIRMEI